MGDCPFNEQLGAYHDGELESSRRQAMEDHLQACPQCAAELAELQKVSQIFADAAAAPQPRLSQISLARMHKRAQGAMEEGLLRIARAISAVAACVLVASSAWLLMSKPVDQPAEPAQAAAGIPPWVDVTVAASRDASSVDTSTPAAAWYLASTSGRADDAP